MANAQNTARSARTVKAQRKNFGRTLTAGIGLSPSRYYRETIYHYQITINKGRIEDF
jgi:hypothetical protein